jgi:hypothetical protein
VFDSVGLLVDGQRAAKERLGGGVARRYFM